MTEREAWELLQDHLEPDAGYEGDEIIESADYIRKYNEAIEIMENLVGVGK